ncbi:hypothetical protein C8J29_104394 [Cereibacter johrii]|uniref:Basic proline-rich protein-like n=1 Tax=Cereibacter johrii TaxID=445629 RepID=A0ABX5J8D4_9RHOB|nr:hypothetical protein C8J29_104394 [Cereibacter johrii]
MRMLAGRTGASGWLRGRKGPRGPGRRRPAGDTCRKRRGDVKPPESRPRAARKAPPKGGPSVSGPPARGSGNGVPAAIRRPPGLPPRPQITEAADPPCWKAKPHSGLDKKTILRSKLRDSDAGRDPLSPKAPAPAIPVEKDLHLAGPGKVGSARKQARLPDQPVPARIGGGIQQPSGGRICLPLTRSDGPAWKAAVPSLRAASLRTFRCAMRNSCDGPRCGKACALRRRRLWLRRRQMPLPCPAPRRRPRSGA